MLTREDVRRLHDLRYQFGGSSRRRKLALLTRCAGESIDDARVLCMYHEALLCVTAYPDDRETLVAASAELRRVAKAAEACFRRGRKRDVAVLGDTGIAGTATDCAFTIDTVKWLSQRFPRDVELAWEDGSAGASLDDVLPILLPTVERDGMLSDHITTRQWFSLATGCRPTNDLPWLIGQFERFSCREALLDHLFDSLELTVRWGLKRAASRTFVRFPSRRLCYQSRALQRSVDAPQEIIQRPPPPPVRLAGHEAQALIDVCRTTLCVRHRETDPVTYANPREIALFRLERGVDVVLLGMQPNRRLPVESFFGYVAAKNRVPVAYGGGWVFLETAEIGMNVFETFRGGESANLLLQILRIYHHHLGVERFEVPPFQIGSDNPEAVRSRAFWFYYRLGFRPCQMGLRALADRDWHDMAKQKGRLGSTSVLRRLAQAAMVLEVAGDASIHRSTPNLADIGIAATHWIGKRFQGDRAKALQWSAAHLQDALGVTPQDLHGWSTDERRAFEQLGLLAASVPDLHRWTMNEKKKLVLLLRAKGGARERVYARRLRKHRRFRAALSAMADQGRRATRSPR